jgi:flagellar hook-length control protein FliK
MHAFPAALAAHRAAPLHRAPDAVATLLHIASERGISRARIALRPAELGGIEVHLSTAAGGVSARLVADSPEAARLLAQAGDDLRRSLAARDVNLVSLEVATSGEDRREAGAGGSAGERSGERAQDRTTPATPSATADVAEPVHSVLELPGGLLVDVLA